MSKQDIIREGIERLTHSKVVAKVVTRWKDGYTDEEMDAWLKEYSDCLFQYLHSQGVVIKTGGEWCIAHGYPLPCQKCGAEYGQATIEPLIEGE